MALADNLSAVRFFGFIRNQGSLFFAYTRVVTLGEKLEKP